MAVYNILVYNILVYNILVYNEAPGVLVKSCTIYVYIKLIVIEKLKYHIKLCLLNVLKSIKYHRYIDILRLCIMEINIVCVGGLF